MIDINFTVRGGYKVNSLGYRAPEFNTIDWSNTYIIQGCSAVFGLGIADDNETINIIEMLEADIKPKGVFMLYPNMDRYPLFNKDKILNIGSWSDREQLTWMDDDNSRTHNLYHMRSYRLLLKANNIPLYETSHHESNRDFCKSLFTNHYNDYPDYGTDGEHFGPITSNIVAKLFYAQFE